MSAIEAGGHVHRYIAERNPPIEEVISQGVIPRFVQFLQRQDAPQLQVKLYLCTSLRQLDSCV